MEKKQNYPLIIIKFHQIRTLSLLQESPCLPFVMVFYVGPARLKLLVHFSSYIFSVLLSYLSSLWVILYQIQHSPKALTSVIGNDLYSGKRKDHLVSNYVGRKQC